MTISFSNKSRLTGKFNTIELDMSQEDFELGFSRWSTDGWLIQDAFLTLTNDEREFIMTGITREEWNKTFGEEY